MNLLIILMTMKLLNQNNVIRSSCRCLSGFFVCSFFPHFCFLILILLIKVGEPAGLTSPPYLHNFLTGSMKERRESDGQSRGEERGDRKTEQRLDSWRLCSASYQYPASVN